MDLGVTDHFFDFFLGQTARGFNTYGVFLSCGLVLGGNIEDTVRVDIKSDFYLGNAARSRRNSVQVEFTDGFVIQSHFPLTLEHMDLHTGLSIRSSREDFAL